MSLQIQNGEHVKSHFRSQSTRSLTPYPTWGSRSAIGRRRDTLLENPIGQSPTLSRQSGPRVSAQSVCGTVRAAEELVLVLPSAGAVYFTATFPEKGGVERKKTTKTARFQRDTSSTRLEIQALPLDLISTSFEVVCGQQLIRTEGFPPSGRTQSRSLPRCVRASQPPSGGAGASVQLQRRRIYLLPRFCDDVAQYGFIGGFCVGFFFVFIWIFHFFSPPV